MSKLLIDNLADQHQWTRIETRADLEAFAGREGEHVLFIPGDPARNLESGDVAVILPEIALYYQHRFDVALIEDAIEREVREQYGVYKTPSLIFLRGNAGERDAANGDGDAQYGRSQDGKSQEGETQASDGLCGEFLGAIPKVRDWDDYITRTTQILSKQQPSVN